MIMYSLHSHRRSKEPGADLFCRENGGIKGNEVGTGSEELTMHFGIDQGNHALILRQLDLEVVVSLYSSTTGRDTRSLQKSRITAGRRSMTFS